MEFAGPESLAGPRPRPALADRVLSCPGSQFIDHFQGETAPESQSRCRSLRKVGGGVKKKETHHQDRCAHLRDRQHQKVCAWETPLERGPKQRLPTLDSRSMRLCGSLARTVQQDVCGAQQPAFSQALGALKRLRGSQFPITALLTPNIGTRNQSTKPASRYCRRNREPAAASRARSGSPLRANSESASSIDRPSCVCDCSCELGIQRDEHVTLRQRLKEEQAVHSCSQRDKAYARGSAVLLEYCKCSRGALRGAAGPSSSWLPGLACECILTFERVKRANLLPELRPGSCPFVTCPMSMCYHGRRPPRGRRCCQHRTKEACSGK